MKKREKTMALVLIGLMTIVLGGLLYFQYYSSQMRSLGNRLRALDDDAFKADKDLLDLTKSMPRLDQAKKLSLPADIVFSKREYSLLLEKLFRESEFSAAAPPTIILKQTELRAATPAAKRPPYTKLTYEVRANGELQSLVEFFEKFYRTPLLHHIRSLTITRPMTSTKSQEKDSLDILMTIEALILDGAEKRKTLIATDLKEADLPKRLGRSTSQYAMIAGNNVFFGPYTKKSESSEPVADTPKKDSAFLAYIRFNGATADDNGIKANIYDEYHQMFYVIRKRPTKTKYLVDTYEQVKDRKIRGDIGEETLTIKDSAGSVYHKYKVLRVDLSDIYLEENGTIYRLHIGNMLAQAQKVSEDQARQLNLPVNEKKQDQKEPDKKSPGKVQSAAKGINASAKQDDAGEAANKDAVKDAAASTDGKAEEK